MNRDEIKRAFDSLTPDEDAKERMLKGIMEKSAAMKQEVSAEPKTLPWYVRFRAQMGICAAAMACVMVFTFAAANPELIKNGSHRSDVIEPVQSGAVTEPQQTTEVFAIVKAEKETESKMLTTACEASEATVTDAVTDADTAEKIVPDVSTAVPPTTKPAETTAVTAASSTATLTTVTITTTQATEPRTTAETEAVTTTVSSQPSLYGDLYDFNHVMWAGRSYDTDYVQVDYSKLSNLLGSGVAAGDMVDGTYTILLYEIEGMPVEDGFAVQYIGQTSYYIFYNVD